MERWNNVDLAFKIQAEWSGLGREGEGTLHLGDHAVRYSGPANMGGKGVGASPEDLLLAAVTACYSGTLMHVLRQAELPADSVAIETDGTVEGFPGQAVFSAIVVNPTIRGGDARRTDAYLEAAERARQHCFIGRTVRDYLDYRVGTVTVS
jgi:peroxiredoxin-like protein